MKETGGDKKHEFFPQENVIIDASFEEERVIACSERIEITVA